MLPWNASLFLVYLLLLTVAGGNATEYHPSCMDSYFEFESANVGSDTSGKMLRNQLHEVFYTPNQHFPYSVAITYQLVNGTKHTNLSSDHDCESELWVWHASPVFLLGDVTYINRYLLYTLNHFMDWNPPHITVALTTAPCLAKMDNFLCKMTASIQDYALGQMENKINLGFVKRGCGISIREVGLSFVDESETILFTAVWITLTCGALFHMLFVWIIFAAPPKWLFVPLKWLFKTNEDKESNDKYSYNKYGVFWGVSASAFLLLGIMLYTYIRSTVTLVTERKYGSKTLTCVLSSLLIICLGGGIPVAIYRARKVTLKVPKIYLCLARPLCSCTSSCIKRKEAESLVITFALWVDLSLLQLGLFQGIVTVMALSAEPFAMTLNLIAIVVAFSVSFIFFSFLFTICGLTKCSAQQQNASSEVQECFDILENPCVLVQENHSFTMPDLEGASPTVQDGTGCRPRVKPTDMTMVLTALTLLPLLLTIMFYGVAIAVVGSVINMETQKNNSISFIFSLAIPIVLISIPVFLQWFITKCLKMSVEGTERATNNSH